MIGDVLDLLAGTANPSLVRMSGSGATCFALYADEADRTAAAATVRAEQARLVVSRIGTRVTVNRPKMAQIGADPHAAPVVAADWHPSC